MVLMFYVVTRRGLCFLCKVESTCSCGIPPGSMPCISERWERKAESTVCSWQTPVHQLNRSCKKLLFSASDVLFWHHYWAFSRLDLSDANQIHHQLDQKLISNLHVPTYMHIVWEQTVKPTGKSGLSEHIWPCSDQPAGSWIVHDVRIMHYNQWCTWLACQ